MEEKENSIKENVRRVLMKYIRNPDHLRNEIEQHNERVHFLNEKTIRLLEFSPIIQVYRIDENGEVKFDGSQLDASSHELLSSIKKQNEIELRMMFPDLYVYTDYLNENDGEIKEFI